MENNSSSGKRSSWLVVNRCLDILMRLMLGPASSDDLLAIIRSRAITDGDDASEAGIRRRFEEDRRRLREWLCEMEYDRSTDEYRLLSVNRSLLELTPQAVRGLAFLQETFSSQDVPMRNEVNVLLDQLNQVLSEKRRRVVKNERGLLELELNARDSDIILDDTRAAVERACAEAQQLQFEYMSPKRADGATVLHQVEPMRIFFDSVRRHYYLEAFCLESWGKKHYEPKKVIAYRLGRISKVAVLPTRFLRGSRRIPKYDLVYELAPVVARLGVTEHFPDSQVIMRSDGSALVRTLSANLFFDLRTLLHYGANCRVIGGDDAVRDMKIIVRAMYEEYFGDKSENSN